MSKIIAVDLDGVLAQFEGWKGEDHIGSPLPGAMEFLQSLVSAGMQPVIFTTRTGPALGEWIQKYLPPDVLECLIVTSTKQPAWVQIDDRAICFTGAYPTVNQILDFKPWWQQK